MLVFNKMYLEVHTYSHGKGIREVVSLHAQEPTVGDTDPKKYSSEVGLQYLSFYMEASDFYGLFTGKVESLNDCGHNVRRMGESYTFYDLDFGREARGVSRVPYVNLQIPHVVARILARAVRMMLKKCVPDGDRIKVEVPRSLRERWVSHYGQGTGKVMLAVADHGESVKFFDQCERDGGPTFQRCVEGLRAIARNTTYRHTDVGTIKLSKDWDGFYFRILRPDGACVLNGGVINHGRDGEQSWSTHT